MNSGKAFAATGILRVLAIVTVVALGLVACTETSTNQGSGTSDTNEDKRKGFHCLSPWDGNHDGLEALIRDEIRDPNSMETIETRITPVNANGNHTVSLTFRSRNGFGGMVENTAVATVDNDSCKATLLSIL